MPTTSNFGWTTPADTDLVKDGAAAIRTLGNGIDTSFLDLKGGTSGQVLSKNSNTDLDYAWVTPNVGDITEVQAGTGISVASGTGPIPVVTNSMATEITAKGDLIVGTGSGTFDNLPAGTNGYTLVADSSVSPTGLKWAAPAGGGKVLQVVYANNSTETDNSTNVYADTNLSATITPTLASSKILVLITHPVTKYQNTTYARIKLRRGSTDILQIAGAAGEDNTSNPNGIFVCVNYLDEPNTTSSTTYKTQFASGTNNAYIRINAALGGVVSNSSITLMEIGA